MLGLVDGVGIGVRYCWEWCSVGLELVLGLGLGLELGGKGLNTQLNPPKYTTNHP